MSQEVDNVISTQIRTLYQEDEIAKSLFDWLSGRERNSTETTAQRASEQADCEYDQIVRVFRLLEMMGCGRLIFGRRGFQTRMRWDYKIIELAKIARGENGSVTRIDDSDVLDEWDDEREDITHTFQLRPNQTISFDLPSDLSQKEAERLSAFVLTLPFNRW